MTTFTSPFTGTVVQPTDVSYYKLNFSADVDLYWPAVVNPTQVPAARIMDCTPSTTGLHINLPQGNQGAVGSDILFRNFGSVSFSIVDFSGVSSVTVNPGESKYYYLSNNSTESGVWQNVTFGTGTSTADAATLQGAGLTTISGQLAVSSNVVVVSSSPTISDTSRASTFVWTAGNGTFTIPAASTLSAGWFIGVRNSGTGTLSISGTGASVINGLVTLTLNPNDSGYIVFQKSTGNFYTIGIATASNVTFTSATYDVDTITGSTYNLTSYAPIIQTYVSLSGTRTTPLAVVLPATTQMYIFVNNAGAGAYSISFNVSGSSSPPITLGTGEVVTVLSDGNSLFALTQSSTGLFYAISGSAGAPPYTFSSNTTTGMYLVGTSILGLTANSTLMLKLDNSNTLAPVLTTPARIAAGSIAGGTF
jgi:hypothetical protein